MLCPRGGDRLGRREGGRHVENSENSEGGASDAEHHGYPAGAARGRDIVFDVRSGDCVLAASGQRR